MWPRIFFPFWSCVNLHIMAKKINPNNYEEMNNLKVARKRVFWHAKTWRKLSFISRISDFERYTYHVSKDYDTETWQKDKKTFPVHNKHTYFFHVFLSQCISCTYAHAALVNSNFFWSFSTHINVYFQLQSVNCRYFCLNEPKKCLYPFQRNSVNRKPNK